MEIYSSCSHLIIQAFYEVLLLIEPPTDQSVMVYLFLLSLLALHIWGLDCEPTTGSGVPCYSGNTLKVSGYFPFFGRATVHKLQVIPGITLTAGQGTFLGHFNSTQQVLQEPHLNSYQESNCWVRSRDSQFSCGSFPSSHDVCNFFEVVQQKSNKRQKKEINQGANNYWI